MPVPKQQLIPGKYIEGPYNTVSRFRLKGKTAKYLAKEYWPQNTFIGRVARRLRNKEFGYWTLKQIADVWGLGPRSISLYISKAEDEHVLNSNHKPELRNTENDRLSN